MTWVINYSANVECNERRWKIPVGIIGCAAVWSNSGALVYYCLVVVFFYIKLIYTARQNLFPFKVILILYNYFGLYRSVQ